MPASAKRQSLLDMSGKYGPAEQSQELLPRAVRGPALLVLWSLLAVVMCGLVATVVLVRGAL